MHTGARLARWRERSDGEEEPLLGRLARTLEASRQYIMAATPTTPAPDAVITMHRGLAQSMPSLRASSRQVAGRPSDKGGADGRDGGAIDVVARAVDAVRAQADAVCGIHAAQTADAANAVSGAASDVVHDV